MASPENPDKDGESVQQLASFKYLARTLMGVSPAELAEEVEKDKATPRKRGRPPKSPTPEDGGAA